MMNVEGVKQQFHVAMEKLGQLIPMEGLKSQAMNVVNILRERLDGIIEKFSGINPVEMLKTHLMDAHHPYGLLLASSPLLSGPAGGIDASGMSAIASASGSLQSSSGSNENPVANLSVHVSGAAALGLSSSAHSPEASLISTGSTLSSMYTEQNGQKVQSGESGLGALSSILGLAAGSDPTIANIVQQSFAVGANHTEAAIMPMLLSAKEAETSMMIEKPIEVSANKIRVNSVVANVFVYNGKRPYLVDGPSMEEQTVIRKGDRILTLHVNQGDKKYSKMEPIARAKAIKHDFQQLCELLDDPAKFGLSSEEISNVESLSKAPIIGVSHLVRLITAKGLPTWTINALPRAMQQFHTLDSQVVSASFGGTRKVRKEDIGVMFLPASMRRLAFN